MLTLPLDLPALLKVAAQVAAEYGCEVRLSKSGGFLVRPLLDRRTSAASSTERVRKHREAKRQASPSEVPPSEVEQCKTLLPDDAPFSTLLPETDETHVTHETVKHVSADSTPSFPPAPPFPAPLSSPPALTPVPPPAREARPRSARRQHTEENLREADSVAVPTALSTPDFLEAWDQWCQHRSALARLNPQKQWTAIAARNTLAECERNGEPLATQAIRASIANGWQSLVWERTSPPRNSGNGNVGNGSSYSGNSNGFNNRPRPKYQAYQASEATRGLTPEQISCF
ncbi:hypothetical protein EI77_00949 [Prosthecobacter fusiformis]|uniref:Uncharacterized protein n=1 Tax=Prosthecobacter fusiformis TaxID=48464 RepID=A0A4R7SSH0_9BACT|nr:hypothetical protein [Prosthecobacter fusiformis]TDU81639.1 hypothetical protein EI77_00949 [Prosthecobacter fusiformis]